MNIDNREFGIRLIKYLIIIFIISIINIVIPNTIDNLNRGIFLGIVASTIIAIYDFFLPSIPSNIKYKLNLI